MKMPVQKRKVQLSVTRFSFGWCFYCEVRLNYKSSKDEISHQTRFISKLCTGTGHQNTNEGVHAPTPWTDRRSLQLLWALPWRSTSAAEPLFVAVVLWPFPGAQRGSAPHGEPKHTKKRVFRTVGDTRVSPHALSGSAASASTLRGFQPAASAQWQNYSLDFWNSCCDFICAVHHRHRPQLLRQEI